MIRRLPLLVALLATPLSAGLVLDPPERMDESDAYEIIAWAAEGEPQACLDSEPADAKAAGLAIERCRRSQDTVRQLAAKTTDLNASDRAVIQVLLGELAGKRVTMALRADSDISARACTATESAVHELGLVKSGLIPLEMEVEAAASRKELAAHLPKCRKRFGKPKWGDPID